VNNAYHVRNGIFHRAFIKKMCYELMHGRASGTSHFRVLVVGALSSRMVILISLGRGPLMESFGLC
jgi:hypothetical protein